MIQLDEQVKQAGIPIALSRCSKEPWRERTSRSGEHKSCGASLGLDGDDTRRLHEHAGKVQYFAHSANL
jgi:hypothetical protein